LEKRQPKDKKMASETTTSSASNSLRQRSVITISRQMGSRGLEVGKAVADLLGYRLVWRELINQAALRSGTPEMALATIDELGLLGLCPSRKACRAYHRAIRQIMQEFATQGSIVIVGRAGQAILRGHPQTIHVRVISPMKTRITRLTDMHGISKRNALAQLKKSDRYRKNYLRKFYRIRWADPDLYDVILNTAHLEPQVAARLIRAALMGE
jgi:cytidylate kinase